jgi:GT2 family glycosyltransferase
MIKPREYRVFRAQSGPIHVMRNQIVKRALDTGCTHLIQLDADMCYPSDAITRLLAHDLDIVGGLCFKRWPPFNPTLFVGEKYEMTVMDPWPNGLVELTATGTACLMVKTEVFAALEPPYFMDAETPDGKPVGEDINFCYRAKDAGFKVWVDTTIETEHLAVMRVDKNLYELNKQLQKQDCEINF